MWYDWTSYDCVLLTNLIIHTQQESTASMKCKICTEHVDQTRHMDKGFNSDSHENWRIEEKKPVTSKQTTLGM